MVEFLTVKAPFALKKQRLYRFALGIAVGLVVFYVANPTLWFRPFSGLKTFWILNVYRKEFNIPVYFFGEFYSPQRPAPFWNGFFWLAATAPLPILCLALWGALKFLFPGRKYQDEPSTRFERRFHAGTALALALTLPLVRCFPGLPVHDGSRLLIASQAFLGVLAGTGIAALARGGRKAIPLLCSVIALGAGGVDVARSAPVYLSFYNAAVGGCYGAFRLGLEPTYYWDSFDRSAMNFLNEELKRAQENKEPTGVLFGSFSSETLEYLARSGELHSDELATISDPSVFTDSRLKKFGFYVTQLRPSGITDFDLEIMNTYKPIGRRYFQEPIPALWGREREVALLEIYKIDQKFFTEGK